MARWRQLFWLVDLIIDIYHTFLVSSLNTLVPQTQAIKEPKNLHRFLAQELIFDIVDIVPLNPYEILIDCVLSIILTFYEYDIWITLCILIQLGCIQRLGRKYRCLSLNLSMKGAADYWPFLRTTYYSLLENTV